MENGAHLILFHQYQNPKGESGSNVVIHAL